METQWYASVAGIVGGTLIIVEVLKRAIGNVAMLKSVPTWAYSVAVAVGLTYTSRALGLLAEQGSTLDVLMNAIVLAASASGFWTWLRQPADQIKNSEPAIVQRVSRGTFPAVLLAFALAAGAASCGGNVAPQLVATEDGVHDALAAAQDGIEKVCAARLTPTACREVNAALVPALRAGAAFNRAVRDQQLSAVGTLVEAIGALVAKVQALSPGELRDAIVNDLRRAIAAAFSVGGPTHAG